MCECLCGETKGHIALVVGDAYLSVDAYKGCKECEELIGIDVRVFTENGAREFLGGATITRATPDDYGGPQGNTVASYELFSIEDLAQAANLLGFKVDPDYDNWRDFMSDHGLQWVQAAMKLCEIRRQARATNEMDVRAAD